VGVCSDLNDVEIPDSGYSRQKVEAVVGNCYVTRSEQPECDYILFKVTKLDGSEVQLDWLLDSERTDTDGSDDDSTDDTDDDSTDDDSTDDTDDDSTDDTDDDSTDDTDDDSTDDTDDEPTQEDLALGFGDLGLWTTTFGSLSSSPVCTEGTAAASVPASGYGNLESIPLDVGAFSHVSVDVFLPPDQANPWWYGYAELVVTAPSVGLYDAYVGQASFAGLPLGTYSTVTFDLPPDIATPLSSGASDVRLRVILNVPYNQAAPYLLDNIVLY